MPHGEIPLQQLLGTFASLFVLGAAITLPLYKFNVGAFLRSSLFTKILLWVPIFIIFLITLYSPVFIGSIVLATIAVFACREAWQGAKSSGKFRLVSIYLTLFLIALSHFAGVVIILPTEAVPLLISICFASVLSDVFAFFFGKYLGKHHLPEALNAGKSWEGVAGQLIGAGVGIAVVNVFIGLAMPWWTFIALGIGSAVGDLSNSFVKRRLTIKDWSQNLPGHGGFLDRFASLASSAMFLFYLQLQ